MTSSLLIARPDPPLHRLPAAKENWSFVPVPLTEHRAIEPPAITADTAMVFILFASILFIVELGTYGALLFSICTAAYVVKQRRVLAEALAQYWFLLAFPALALFSTIWSSAPADTLKHGLEYMLTVFAAILLLSTRNKRTVVLGMFAAFALYTAVSLAVGHVVAVGNSGATAVSGLADSKNEEADMAGTGLILSGFVLVSGIAARRLREVVLAAAAACVQAYAMVAADSAGALAATLVAGGMFFLLIAMRRAARGLRTAVLGGIGGVIGLLSVLFLIFTSDVLNWLALEFHKDLTLTGRTYLWARARDLVIEHPLAGMGFDAFWQQGNLDAEGLWQFAGIQNREGFNFHSTLYDTLVGLGWVGVLVYGCTIIAGLYALTRAYVRQPTLLACFWLTMATYILVRMPIESIGLNAFYFTTVLLFAILGAAWTIGEPRAAR